MYMCVCVYIYIYIYKYIHINYIYTYGGTDILSKKLDVSSLNPLRELFLLIERF
jgi:hypothetical protein